MQILLADDEKTIAITLSDALVEAGHEVDVVEDGSAALDSLGRNPYDAVVTDIRMPGRSGMDILHFARELNPPPAVLIMTGFATIEQAVEAIKEGAETYIQKPFPNELVVQTLEKIAHMRELERENERLRSEMTKGRMGFEGIVGRSRGMAEVFKRIRTVGPTEATILITGESGTGKERIARAVHESSPRIKAPFVALSCAILAESLLESELFGHEAGAFTDARKARKGCFELAEGGTIFLDDIDDAPANVQVKFLRVLEQREIQRVGGEQTIPVDIRVVTATKLDLRNLVKEGKFRDDLFYRLNVVPIDLPPLRDREGDIPLLLEHFIQLHGGGRDYKVRPDVLDAMQRYPWPGNVRELENAVARAIALSGGATYLKKEHLLPMSTRYKTATEVAVDLPNLREVTKKAEMDYINQVLQHTGGHRTQAAEILGISRKVLWEKLRDFGIDESKKGDS